MRFGWFPWKYLIRRAARKHGFLDPIALVSRMRKFAQPADVTEPIELIRAGVLFHARGLINTRAIQHNLDWIWPFWVERQFNPHCNSFIPRAFSVTHVNLTHRNWTAVGVPGFDAYPVIDPRGLVTPLWDSWSIDAWIVMDHAKLIPSRLDTCTQQWLADDEKLTVRTICEQNGMRLESSASAVRDGDQVYCEIQYHAETSDAGFLILSLRPYNPEGVTFINSIRYEPERPGWLVNRKDVINFYDCLPDHHYVSRYKDGDVSGRLADPAAAADRIRCDIGLATAAVSFGGTTGDGARACLRIPLTAENEEGFEKRRKTAAESWGDALTETASLTVPDKHFQFLYDAAVKTLVLLSPGWVYPGPYTYRRFWYRDAVFIMNALLAANLKRRTEKLLERFPQKQQVSGFFHSQEGEWDSNGEVLWMFAHYCDLTGSEPAKPWIKAIIRGGEWIRRKRLKDAAGSLHNGLLPPGFSAEHFGNIDYYYWDDYWGIAGLSSCARLLRRAGHDKRAQEWSDEAREFLRDVDASINASQVIRNHPGIPASPHRRMDAGCIGVLAASYPLDLMPAQDERLRGTVEYLLDNCLVHKTFFQDMIHSGMNMYLTLHLAQVMMRQGDHRFFELIQAVARFATATGQWPEAIHPLTLGGCMGDGQHGWAAAEWIMMLRNMFVYEADGQLVLGAGIPAQWLDSGQPMRFGPTPTPYGDITVEIIPAGQELKIAWTAAWRGPGPTLKTAVAGMEPVIEESAAPTGTIRLTRSAES